MFIDTEDFRIEYVYSTQNIHIVDSYLIRDAATMKKILKHIVEEAGHAGIHFKRTISSWVREWKAHNYLYDKNIQQSRTKSVDLNESESLLKRLGYFVISLFYR